MPQKIHIGTSVLQSCEKKISGEYVLIEGEQYYKISNSDQMNPFFMSIVSDSDHWMFIASNGGLSAGRKNPDHTLFPYYTDDKIIESSEITGSKSIFQIDMEGKLFLWEPFSNRYEGVYAISRNLYKNYCGNKIIFEEINHDLQVAFSYAWNTAEEFGFVKKSNLKNLTDETIQIKLLDGLQNIMPPNVGQQLQNSKSTLVDAYKKNELCLETGLALILLSATIVDKPEPSESLKATTLFSLGLNKPKYLLSSRQLNNFRKGMELTTELDVRAEKGAYFVNSTIHLAAREKIDWLIVADIDQSPSDMANLKFLLKDSRKLAKKIIKAIEKNTQNLLNLVANADGFQLTGNSLSAARHFSNVLFNIMRGGVFDQNYTVPASDFKKYVYLFNKSVYKRNYPFFSRLLSDINYQDLMREAAVIGDTDFERLTMEYLPLVFSRRHGDPSRPWNRFSIEVKNSDNSKIFNYEGNWRDIFQNWEALALTYPDFVIGMIAKFVNASTIDGYNPYRITKEGIDWEKIEPDDPWAFLGYWGDHQIIYLLKLLEIAQSQDPEHLNSLLDKKVFSYASVPYKIKTFSEILTNPKDTIVYDHNLEAEINKKIEEIGVDGKMILNTHGEVHKVNFVEKLLVTTLAKFSNFIPEAGIWLNTQRPEWNDANNGLVGNGTSMVTLYYLYRFQKFCKKLILDASSSHFILSKPLYDFLLEVTAIFEKHSKHIRIPLDNIQRKKIFCELGLAGEKYRSAVYSRDFFGNIQKVSVEQLDHFFDLSLKYLAHSIKANKRADGLYHAYNLIDLDKEDEIRISHLYKMLEGQVAVLSSGFLSAQEVVEILYTLRQSNLYRKDQNSFLLYPDRKLSRFEQKNNIPEQFISESKLLQSMIEDGYTEIVEKDQFGVVHFNSNFQNATDLKIALDLLKVNQNGAFSNQETVLVLDIFERIFKHRSFTGRSGTFFAYEGLGSIYWHMVSKLLLAVQENYFWALESNANDEVLNQLRHHYYEIKAGIGVDKSPEHYGAFPTDPYSHTPANNGAQQPGMTGQVKEDIITRMGELGIKIKGRIIQFKPSLLQEKEFLKTSIKFKYYDLDNCSQEIILKANSLAFTLCKVPIIYTLDDQEQITVHQKNGQVIQCQEMQLDSKTSTALFERSGSIKFIEVALTRTSIHPQDYASSNPLP